MGDGAKSGDKSVLEFRVDEIWKDLYEGDEPLVETFRSDRAVQQDRDASADKRQRRLEVLFTGALALFTAIEVIHLFRK